MGWATAYIAMLQQGQTVKFRPRGNSMTPTIKSGALCTVVPSVERLPKKGDIVLCKVNGYQYLHLISAIRQDSVQISNNHGHVNGWTNLRNVYGYLVDIEP